jgi:hypothetical protein
LASTSVVIDMQASFHAAHNPYTIYHVIKEIKNARKNKNGIVIVQYEQGGRLIYQVENALKKYSNVDFVWKNQNDGSQEICQSISENYFNLNNLTICGVNTDSCVQETVESLSLILPETTIEVVEDGCNSIYFNDFGWLKDLPNVILRESEYSNV